MKGTLIFVALLACLSARILDAEGYAFTQYLSEFEKVYEQRELAYRREIFEKNLRTIIEHNSNPSSSFKMGINKFTDQTADERNMLNGYKKSVASLNRATSNAQVFKPTGIKVPASFDWRDHQPSILTPVKNQGKCGSCWTFAAVSTLESHWALATGKLEHLSEQQIASCALNPHHCGGTGGCHGGISQLAFQHVIDVGGIASEWTYPYSSFSGKNFDCTFNPRTTPPAAAFASFVNIEENSYDGLIEALVTQGPISVNVDASNWHFYDQGVFDGCSVQNPDVNHVVQLVGYGTDPVHGDFWTIRNSWSPTWGENGFIRIKRTGNGELCGTDRSPQDGTGCDGGPETVTTCGMCGILYDGSFPVAAVSLNKFLD